MLKKTIYKDKRISIDFFVMDDKEKSKCFRNGTFCSNGFVI